MIYLVVDTETKRVIARFKYGAQALNYVAFINERLNQPDRHIVVTEE